MLRRMEVVFECLNRQKNRYFWVLRSGTNSTGRMWFEDDQLSNTARVGRNTGKAILVRHY